MPRPQSPTSNDSNGRGSTNVMCLIQMGTLTQDQQLETIRLWGEHVIPYFRERDASIEQAS